MNIMTPVVFPIVFITVQLIFRMYYSLNKTNTGWVGRYIDRNITTMKWIILAATSNHTKDLTGAIVVTSIQRYYI